MPKCLCCRKCGNKEDMVNIPENYERFLESMNISVEEIEERKKKYKTHLICIDHLPKLRSSKRQLDIEKNHQTEERNKVWERNRPRQLTCRYCGLRCLPKQVTPLPRNTKVLEKWFEILGPEFRDEVKLKKKNFICLSHFVIPEGVNIRKPNNLPIPLKKKELDNSSNSSRTDKTTKVKEQNEKEKYSYPLTCRYCGQKCDPKKMTSVPKREDILEKWIEILGPEFENNLHDTRRNYICLNHFKIPDGAKNRRHYNFPIPMKNDNQIPDSPKISDSESIENDDSYDDENDDNIMPELERFDFVEKDEDEQFDLNENIEDSINTISLKKPKKELAGLKIRYQRNRECQYCGERKRQQLMTKTPTTKEVFEKWCKILGKKFERNAKNNSMSMICLSHFDIPPGQKTRRMGDLPISNKIEKRRQSQIKLDLDDIYLDNLKFFGYAFDDVTNQVVKDKNAKLQ